MIVPQVQPDGSIKMESTGTGKWRMEGVPHKGWTCVNIDDLEEPSHLCEMCEAQEVRYVHTMTHPDYPQPLQVGCVCAGNMEQNIELARQRESQFKNKQKRRIKWLEREWLISHKGNPFLNVDNFHIVLYPKGNTWEFKIRDKTTNTGYDGTGHDTEKEAKLAVFDAMILLKDNRPEEPEVDLQVYKPEEYNPQLHGHYQFDIIDEYSYNNQIPETLVKRVTGEPAYKVMKRMGVRKATLRDIRFRLGEEWVSYLLQSPS